MTTCHLVADGNLTFLRNVHAYEFAYAGIEFVFVFASEHFDVHYYAAFAVRYAKGSVTHFASFFAENRAQQSFFRSKVGFSLGGNLTYQDVAGMHFRTDTNYAVLIQILQCVVADVGDVASELLGSEFGFTALDFVFLDVDTCECVFLDEFFRQQYGVFVVVAFPRHETDENVTSESQLSAFGTGTVGKYVAFFDAVARMYDNFLVDARTLVATYKLFKRVGLYRSVVGLDGDFVRRRAQHHAVFLGNDHHAAVVGYARFDTGSDNGRFGIDQRHRLTLHVGSHQRTVGVVVFKEGDKTCCNGNKLTRRYVDEVHLFARELQYFFTTTACDTRVHEVAVFVKRLVGLTDDILVFLVGSQILHRVGDRMVDFVYTAVGSFDKAVLVDASVSCQ